MKKKFAFLLMGGHYDPEKHQACFETENQISYIFTVRNFEEACQRVSLLQKDGVGAIELCGAFGPEKAQQLIEQTGNQIAIGYMTHNAEQDPLFASFFSEF